MDFYIETNTGVMGGRFDEKLIGWIESEIATPSLNAPDLNKIVRIYEDNISASKASNYRVTNLAWFFADDVSAETMSFRFHLAKRNQAVQVSRNTVRLELNSEYGSTVTLWIDTKSKKALKAMEGDKQIYPKSLWRW